jgi:hypothetical protein
MEKTNPTKKRFPGWLGRALVLLAMAAPIAGLGLASTSSYYLDASRLEVQVSPDTNTASGTVKVSSNSDRKIRLKVLPKLWRLTPQGVLTYVDPPSASSASPGQYNLLDNLSINPEEFDLLPGKSRLVRFLVKTPPEAGPSEYAFQLHFQPTDLLEAAAKAPASGVRNVIDVIFTTTVYVYQGNPAPAPAVRDFQCGWRPDAGRFSVSFQAINSGKKHARLFGNVVITPKAAAPGAQPLDVLHLQNSTLIIVFPDSPRLVQEQPASETIKKPAPGDYRMELQLVDERNSQPAVQAACDFTVPANPGSSAKP